MKIAAVLDAKGQTILPLPDGPTIRVHDTETGQTQDLPNPAYGKDTDRRPTAARALVAAGVDVVVVVPGSFCTPSHKIAVQGQIRFWQVPQGQTWNDLWKNGIVPTDEQLDLRLPQGELMKQNMASLKHYAKIAIRRLRK